MIAWDTETFLIEPGIAAPKLVCASHADAKSAFVIGAYDARVLFPALLRKETIGGANLVYDLGVHCADDARNVDLVFKALDEGRLVSTDILEALYDNARGLMFKEANGTPFGRYTLALCEARYLGINRDLEKYGENAWRLRYAELVDVPLSRWPQDAIDYPKHDARGTYDVLLEQLAPNRENLQCARDEMQAAWALHLSRIWGMRTDPLMVPEVVAEIVKEHDDSRKRFFESGIVKVRPCVKKDGEMERADDVPVALLQAHDDREDVQKAFKALSAGKKLRYGEDKKVLAALVSEAYAGEAPVTEKGAVSTSRDTLLESGDELLEAYAETGGNEKLLSTYVDVLQQGTKVPINPEVNSIVATQRTSYRKPNLQNLPRKGRVRECFVPRLGWLFVSVDYSALELCTLGQVCLNLFQQSAIADAINAGQDLHVRMAARIDGSTYEGALARYKAKDTTIKNLRQSAKPINFGLPGLMGPPKLVFTARKDGVRFCELAGVATACGNNPKTVEYAGRSITPTCVECLTLAIKYRKLWYAEWPEMVDYHKVTVELTNQGDPIDSFGTGMLRLESSPNAVSNHFFQNLAAQGAKHALYNVQKEAYTDRSSVMFNALRPVVFVHDEIIAEVREEVAHEASMRLAEVMVASMREFVPGVKISAEPALMRRWFKGAEKSETKDRHLKPWWPKVWTWEPDQEVMRKDLES